MFLTDIVQRQAEGSGGLLAIDGEAGIGKTTLLGELASLARRHRADVLWVRCTEADQIRPFGALLDAIDCRLQHPDAAYRRVAEAVVATIEPVIDPFRFDSDAAWRRPVQEAIVDLLIEALDRGSVFIVVDDVQWADAGTGAVLSAIARRTQSSRLVMAWTQRSSIRSQTADDLKARFRDHLHLLTVGPLDRITVETFGAQLLGHPLDPVQSTRLEQAGGNPFFVGALLAHDGDTTRADVVQQWLDRLPTDTSDVLSTASLLGLDFELSVLAHVVHRDPTDLVRLLEPAARAGVVLALGTGRYSFTHDLIRAAAESSLPRSLQAAMHRELARVLEAEGADVGMVARHLARGARPGDEATAERIRVACASVMCSDAGSAATLLEVAVGLCTPGSHTWAEVMADWVLALQWSARATQSLELANAAVAQPMPAAVGARLRMMQATSHGLVNDFASAATAYRSIADDTATPPDIRALVLAELATIEAWGLDRGAGRSTASKAIKLAKQCGALQAELQALCALSTMSLFDGELRDAIAHAREAVTLGRHFNSLAPAREVYLGLSLAYAGEHEEADIWFRKGQAAAEAVSDLWLVSRYQLARMSSEMSTGEWESVVADAEAVIALHDDTGMGSGMPQGPASAGIVAVRRGAPDEVISRYRHMASKHASPGSGVAGLLFTGWMEALVAEREGRLPEAVGILNYAYETVVGNARLVQVWLAPDLVRVLLATGDRQRAAAVAAELGVFAEEVVQVSSALGSADLCAGLVAMAAGDERGVTLLQRAADRLRSARCLPALMQALDALPATPTVVAERGQLAARLGIHRSQNVPAAARFRSPLEGLTPTERAIAELVASGFANPAIAAQLGLSKRTVEYHVSNIYMKLGVTSRMAVARLVDQT